MPRKVAFNAHSSQNNTRWAITPGRYPPIFIGVSRSIHIVMGVYPKGIQIYTPITKEFSIPILSRSFVAAPFQLGLVWLSVLSTLPPNPSACLRVGVWDKPWDKYANYFETASPQFRFCPGDKNGLVLMRIIAQTVAKAADFPLWRLFGEVNPSQRLCRLAFPQVRWDAEGR